MPHHHHHHHRVVVWYHPTALTYQIQLGKVGRTTCLYIIEIQENGQDLSSIEHVVSPTCEKALPT